jgi:hypothetical protein
MNVSGDQLPRNESVRGRMGDHPPPPPAPSPPESVNESAGQDFGKRRHTGPGFIPARFGRRMHTRGQDSRFGQRRHTKAAVLISGRRDTISGLAAGNGREASNTLSVVVAPLIRGPERNERGGGGAYEGIRRQLILRCWSYKNSHL